ncbi:hypothetical protein ABPG75_011283 [Micractinium tetrahymenae]
MAAPAPNGSRKAVSLDFAAFEELVKPLPRPADIIADAPGELIKAASAPAAPAVHSTKCASLSQPAFFSTSSPVPVGSPKAASPTARAAQRAHSRFDPPAASSVCGGVAAALMPAAFDAFGRAIRADHLGSYFDSHIGAAATENDSVVTKPNDACDAQAAPSEACPCIDSSAGGAAQLLREESSFGAFAAAADGGSTSGAAASSAAGATKAPGKPVVEELFADFNPFK